MWIEASSVSGISCSVQIFASSWKGTRSATGSRRHKEMRRRLQQVPEVAAWFGSWTQDDVLVGVRYGKWRCKKHCNQAKMQGLHWVCGQKLRQKELQWQMDSWGRLGSSKQCLRPCAERLTYACNDITEEAMHTLCWLRPFIVCPDCSGLQQTVRWRESTVVSEVQYCILHSNRESPVH